MKFRISNQQAKEYMERRRYELRVAEIKRRLQEDYNVFISYSHSDNLLAQQLTSLFNKFKINYIIDEKELDWGDKIADFAREEITACSHYLLILSEASTKSQWCQLEFGMAYGLKKEMLIFLANKKVELPGFATNILATSDIKLVSGYFSQGLIDPQDVDRFIKEIINDQQANLKDFKHGSECEEEHKCWDAPDSDELKSDTLGTRALYLDDFFDTSVYRLSRIELGEPFASEAV